MTAETVYVQAQHPYNPSQILFRDPFLHDQLQRRYDSSIPSTFSPILPLLARYPERSDMNYVAPATWQDGRTQRYDHNSRESATSSVSFDHGYKTDTAAVADTFGRGQREVMRPLSPASLHWPTQDGYPRTRQGSTDSSIAPSFQIPRFINDSGGSLAELAAEITCLFWFETTEYINAIEKLSSNDLCRQRPLSPNARPGTGFRKWVTTILSTTLVAQNVVVLALLFIYRLKQLNPVVEGKLGSEYRLLTIALMLGNKFLDDNTYTNKTWAEVSGINVSEVHVMEVEFLSNMKYSLYTSAEDWKRWTSKLNQFASFVKLARASPIQTAATYASTPQMLQLTSVGYPTPPATLPGTFSYSSGSGTPHPGLEIYNEPTLPVPMTYTSPVDPRPSQPESRKRVMEELGTDITPKKVMKYSLGPSPLRATTSSGETEVAGLRLPLPNLAIPPASYPQQAFSAQTHTLPTMSVASTSNRSSAFVPLAMSTTGQMSTLQPGTYPSAMQTALQMASRQQSPFIDSRGASPMSGVPISASSLQPPTQISPNYFLQQRSSPYRPVHPVSTLLHAPPSTALKHRLSDINQDHMHYQPLGKPIQAQQSGCLPYVSQNVWTQGPQLSNSTPVQQWPGLDSTYLP